MFQKARIRLTVWYLLITACVGFLFSVAIYSDFNRELTRIERTQQVRLQDEQNGYIIPTLPRIEYREGNQIIITPGTPQQILKEVSESRLRLISLLALINLGIIAVAGAGGYILAGKTLKPIQDMMDSQSRFVTDASHELRTPITSLKTAIEVTLRDKKMKLIDAKETLESNLHDVNNLQALTNNLILLSQYQNNGNGEMRKESIEEIVMEAIKRVAVLAKAKHISIQPSVQPFSILGNKQSLIELFVIFLDNAIKYSPKNAEVSITTVSKEKVGKIIIKDSGIGISKEDLPYIFERFYRADKSRTKSEEKGYGLGLAIAKEIVSKHNGEVFAKSNEQGTIITVTLPREYT